MDKDFSREYAPKTSALEKTLGALSTVSPLVKGAVDKYVEDSTSRAIVDSLRGASIEEIRKNDPWSGILGDSRAVQGAIESKAKGNAIKKLNGLMSNVETVSKMTDEEQTAYIAKAMEAEQTGDPEVDASTLSAMVQALPQSIDTITRATYKYRKQKYEQDFSDGLVDQGEQLNHVLDGVNQGITTKDEAEASKNVYLNNLTPPEGMSPESYYRSLTKAASSMMSNGNFSSAQLIDEVMSAAPTDVQEYYQSAKASAQANYLKYNAATDTSKHSISTKISMGIYSSKDELLEDINNSDLEHRAATLGKPLFTQSQKDALVHKFEAKNIREAKELAKATEAEMLRNNNLQTGRQGWFGGNKMAYDSVGKDLKMEIDNEVYEGFVSNEPQSSELLIRNADKGLINPIIQAEVQAEVDAVMQGTSSPDSILKLKDTVTRMGPAAQDYVGNSALVSSIANLPEEVKESDVIRLKNGFRAIKNQQKIQEARSVASPQENKLIDEAIEGLTKGNVLNGWIPWYSKKQQSGYQEALRSQVYQTIPEVKASMPNATTDRIVQKSIDKAKSRVDNLGSHYVTRFGSKSTASLINSKLKVPLKSFDGVDMTKVLHSSIEDSVGKGNHLGDKVNIDAIYASDDDGERLYINGTNTQGELMSYVVTIDSLAENVQKELDSFKDLKKAYQDSVALDAEHPYH